MELVPVMVSVYVPGVVPGVVGGVVPGVVGVIAAPPQPSCTSVRVNMKPNIRTLVARRSMRENLAPNNNRPPSGSHIA